MCLFEADVSGWNKKFEVRMFFHPDISGGPLFLPVPPSFLQTLQWMWWAQDLRMIFEVPPTLGKITLFFAVGVGVSFTCLKSAATVEQKG